MSVKLSIRLGTIGLLVGAIVCGLTATAPALELTETILPATNPAGIVGDRNGWDVAIDGDTIIVGAPGLGDPGANVARVYVNDGSAWSYQATLQPSGALDSDYWGQGVALQGDTAAIGGRNYSAVAVFNRSGTTWTEGQTLLIDNANGRYGNSVALDGNWLVGGAERDNNVYISELDAGTWSDPVVLDKSAATLGTGKLGYDVAIDGDWIIGGATDGNAAHFWKYDSGSEAWAYHSGIEGADGGLFGVSVDLEGERAIVGARGAAGNDGKAYIYGYNSGTDTWDLEQTLDGETDSDELFGSAVSLCGDMAVVGAYSADIDGTANAGAAYVYTQSGGTWSLDQKITAETPIAGGGYGGNAVACTDSEIVVGAPHRDSWAASGMAYVYDISADEPSLDGDLNEDGFVGGDDLDIVRSFWGQNVTPGDLLQGDPSGDGFVGGDDLDIVRGNWGAGTPPAPSAVPEPSTLLLLLAAGPCLAWAACRRRKSA